MNHAVTRVAAALAAVGLAAAACAASAAPAITVGGVSPRAAAMSNINRAQRSNNAVLNSVQRNINASQRARYRAQ